MNRKPALGFIFVTLLLDILGIGLIIPILPKLIEQLSGGDIGAAAHTYGWLAMLYSLMQFGCAPVLGSLSDRFGRRAVLLTSLFGSGADYLLLAFAPTLPWFFVGRLIAGITGASMSTAQAYIADISAPEQRARNFGMVAGAFGLGFVLGPAVGGILGEHSLRLPFFAAAGLTFLNWCYGLFVLPESLPPEKRRGFSWKRANPIGSLVALQAHPLVIGLAMTYFLMMLGHQTFPSTWVLYTSYRYDWTPRQVGVSLAIVGIMAMIVQGGFAGKIIPKLGERRSIIIGLINATVFMIAYGIAGQGWMLYGLLVAGSLLSIAGPALQSLITSGVPSNEQGALQGALSSLSSLAGIIAPPITTSLFSYFISPAAPIHLPGVSFFLGAGLMFLAMILALNSFARERTAVAPQAPRSA